MYGNGYVGVLEANYALASCHLISAIFGADIWHETLGTFVPGLPPAIGQHSALMALFWTAVVCMAGQMAGQVWRVFRQQCKMDARERGHKELGTLNALKHLLYFVAFFALSFIFLLQPLGAGRYKGRMMLEVVSICYSIIATQVIIAHMAKEAYRPSVAPFLALALGIASWGFGVFPGDVTVYALAATVLAGYIHYVFNVVDQICGHLGIQCLVIPAPE